MSTKELIADLKDFYMGRTCLILACGPSIHDVPEENIYDLAKNKIVFAIKQAFDIAPGLINYHFLNSANYKPYNYSVWNPYKIVELASNEKIPYLESLADIFLTVEQNWDFSKALSSTLDFDKWTFDNSIVRPWGPGIMYETVFYMAYHMGFSDIYTLGWDLGPVGSTTREHFYTENVINPANRLEQNESLQEIEMTKHLYIWLKEKGVNLTIINKSGGAHQSYASSVIPRVMI
jgi:hypothetical protein